MTSIAINRRDLAQCASDARRCNAPYHFYWTVIGVRHGREGRMERFIHRHYPDGFVLPVHAATVTD